LQTQTEIFPTPNDKFDDLGLCSLEIQIPRKTKQIKKQTTKEKYS
jgi:hypothetical protein